MIINKRLMVFALDVLKILGNDNRRRILRLLCDEELHINGIAKKLGISPPLVFKHVAVLEKHGFIERRRIGSAHLLRVKDSKLDTLRKVFNATENVNTIDVKKGETLLDAFRMVSGIGVKKTPKGYIVESVEGRKGYFLVEVNGKLPNKPLDKIVLNSDSEISFYYLKPVLGKRFAIHVE